MADVEAQLIGSGAIAQGDNALAARVQRWPRNRSSSTLTRPARGLSYISKLHAMSERIVPIEPPAHDLTDFWKSGGDLRQWIARHVYEAMASALNQQSASTPMRWRKVFSRIQAELALSAK
jgi:hypothetical protein